MINLDAIYVDVDDFCLLFEPQWITHLIETGEKQRNKPSRLSHSEVMTILIAFRGTATIRDNSTKKHLNFMKYIEYVNAIADDYVLLIHFLFNG